MSIFFSLLFPLTLSSSSLCPEKPIAFAPMHRLGIYRVHLVALLVATKKARLKMFSILFALHLSVWRCVLWIKRKRKLNLSQRKKRRPFLFSSKASLCEHCICMCGWSNVRPSFPRLLFSLSGAPFTLPPAQRIFPHIQTNGML